MGQYFDCLTSIKALCANIPEPQQRRVKVAFLILGIFFSIKGVLYSRNFAEIPVRHALTSLVSSVKASWRRHENAPSRPRFSSHCLRCSFSPNSLAAAVNATVSATFSEVSSSDELELELSSELPPQLYLMLYVAITYRNLEVFFSWHFLHNYGTRGYSSFASSTHCRSCVLRSCGWSQQHRCHDACDVVFAVACCPCLRWS